MCLSHVYGRNKCQHASNNNSMDITSIYYYKKADVVAITCKMILYSWFNLMKIGILYNQFTIIIICCLPIIFNSVTVKLKFIFRMQNATLTRCLRPIYNPWRKAIFVPVAICFKYQHSSYYISYMNKPPQHISRTKHSPTFEDV